MYGQVRERLGREGGRAIFAIVLLAALGLARGTAAADDGDRERQEGDAALLGKSLDVWETVDGKVQLRYGFGIDGCVDHLKALSDAKAPESITFELAHDTPDLKAGKHRWTDGRAACSSLIAALARRNLRDGISDAIFFCKEEALPGAAELDGCTKAYNDALKGGIPPTEVFKDKDGTTGEMKALYELWCAAPRAKLEAAGELRAAPFKKALKNDKLRIALADAEYIELAGGGKPTPEHLAAASVWFKDSSPFRHCANGKDVHVLYRYQFNPEQKLVKSTEREFCGLPPASAFR